MTQILIRTAEREDLRETVEIYLECLRSDYACKPQAYLNAKNVDVELAECEQWLYQSGHPNRVYVALDGSRMAGYIAVGPNIGGPLYQEGEVTGFFVRRAYRRLGVGLRLLKAGASYLRSLGYSRAVIYNYHESEANGFYRRLGGEVIHQEIQAPGGKPLETDVFCYGIEGLLATLDQRMALYRLPE